MSYLFNTFLYQPILNVLVFFYNFIPLHDLGIAIILMTAIVRLALYPIYQKTMRQQALSVKMSPEVLKIQKDYKDNHEEQTQKLLELYKKYKVNPFYIIFAIAIQIPVFLAVWRVITAGASGVFTEGLYAFISNPGLMNKVFLGMVDLTQQSIPLIIIAGAAQLIQSKLGTPKPSPDAPKQPLSASQMGLMMVGLTIVILWKLPAALALYWTTNTVFSIIQQWIVNKTMKNEEPKRNNQ